MRQETMLQACTGNIPRALFVSFPSASSWQLYQPWSLLPPPVAALQHFCFSAAASPKLPEELLACFMSNTVKAYCYQSATTDMQRSMYQYLRAAETSALQLTTLLQAYYRMMCALTVIAAACRLCSFPNSTLC